MMDKTLDLAGPVAAVMSVEAAEQRAVEKLIGEKAGQLSAQYKVGVRFFFIKLV